MALFSQQLMFLPSKTEFAVLGDHNQILVKDLQSGNLIRSFDVPNLAQVLFMPDQQHALLHSETRGRLRLCDLSQDNACTDLSATLSSSGLAALLTAPDRLLVLTQDGEVLDINPQTGALQNKLVLFRKSVFATQTQADVFLAGAFLDQGRTLAISQGPHILIFSIPQGILLQTLDVHSEDVLSVHAFSQAGKLSILSTSADETAILSNFDSAVGRYIPNQRYMGHTGRVLQAQFSADGQRVITCGEDRTARMFQSQTGMPLGIYRGHEDRVENCALSADGKVALSVSAQGTAPLKVWSLDPGSTILGGPKTYQTGITSASFSPDGKYIVSVGVDGNFPTAKVWNRDPDGTFNSQPEILGGGRTYAITISSATFSPDSKRIITTGDDGTSQTPLPVAIIWTRNPDGSWNPFKLGGTQTYTVDIHSASFSPDGTRIVTTGTDGTPANKLPKAKVWTQTSNGNFNSFVLGGTQTYTNTIASASFSQDGTRIVTAGVDGNKAAKALVWTQDSNGNFTLIPEVLGGAQSYSDFIGAASFSPDGTRILAAGTDPFANTVLGNVKVWTLGFDGNFSNPSQILGGTQTYTHAIGAANFASDGLRIITVGQDGFTDPLLSTAKIWTSGSTGIFDGPPQILGGTQTYTRQIFSAGFSADNLWIVTTGQDGPSAAPTFTAKIWKADQSKLIAAFTL